MKSLLISSPGRCGMHWLARILQELLGLEQQKTKRWCEMGEVADGQLYLTHDPIAYFIPIMDKVNCIAMVRDPRDMIVSVAYYLAGLARDNWNGAGRFWDDAGSEGASFQEALVALKQDGHNSRWFSTYLQTDMPHFVVRYEDLHRRAEEVMRHLLHSLGHAEPYRCAMDQALQKASFEHMSGGRQRGEEDPAHFFRKGIIDDWRNHFTNEESLKFQARFLETFQTFGYS